MKLDFSFKDVLENDLDQNRQIDLSRNTVIFGNNGRGKTRILTAIDKLHKISNIEIQSNVFDLVEELNLATLQIDGKNFTELFRSNNKIFDNTHLKRYIKSVEFALKDLYSLLKELSGLSFVFEEVLRRHLAELRLLLQVLEGRQHIRVNSLSKVERVFRNCSSILKRLSSNIPHGFYTTDNGFADERDIILIIRNSLSINEYLLRSLEDIRYSELENVKKTDSLRAFQKDLELSLKKNNTHYIAPDTNLDTIINKIEEKIKKQIEKYGYTFFESEDIADKTRKTVIKKIEEIQQNITNVNKLIISGYGGLEIVVQSGRLKMKKNSEEIGFDKLSSGEKRIIKLFLSVVFEDANIYLIDEPEISLSLNFQSKLINDLISLCEAKGSRMVLATHAPYIFRDCINNSFERLEL